jgi:hypothetical protein
MKKNFGIIICVVALVLTIVLSSVAIGEKAKVEGTTNPVVNEIETTEEFFEDITEDLTEECTKEIVEETTKTQKVELPTKKSEKIESSEITIEPTEKEELKAEDEQVCEDEFICGGVVDNTGHYLMLGLETSLFHNENSKEKLASYYSTDESVAVVDEYGTITAVGLGEAMIYAEKENGMERFESEVIVCPGFSMSLMVEPHYGGVQYVYANIDGILPEGSYIEWTADNDNFELIELDDGMTLQASAKQLGATTVTATVYYSDGAILAQESIEIDTHVPSYCDA